MKAMLRNRLTSILFAILTMVAAGSGTASAAVTSYDPATIAAALQNAGYKAKVAKDKDGDPMIETASEGNEMQIRFSGCKNGGSCDQVELLTLWDCSGEVKKCQKIHEEWRSEENFSQSLLVDDVLVLYKHLFLDKIGISEELFIRNFVVFSSDAVALMAKY